MGIHYYRDYRVIYQKTASVLLKLYGPKATKFAFSCCTHMSARPSVAGDIARLQNLHLGILLSGSLQERWQVHLLLGFLLPVACRPREASHCTIASARNALQLLASFL